MGLANEQQEMLSWIAEAVVGIHQLGMKLSNEIDPIAVMRTDTRLTKLMQLHKRQPWDEITPAFDLARRYFISREQSPVGNFFEKKPSGRANSRLMHTATTFGMMAQKGNMPEGADCWLRARVLQGNCRQNHRLGFRLPRVQPKMEGASSEKELLMTARHRPSLNPYQGWTDHERGLLRSRLNIPEDGRRSDWIGLEARGQGNHRGT